MAQSERSGGPCLEPKFPLPVWVEGAAAKRWLARARLGTSRVRVERVQQLLERVAQRRQTTVMGVINLTPDSFFDGGSYCTDTQAEARVKQVLAEGAELVDIGGESSKPGAAAVAPNEQIRRIRGALGAARQLGATISVDTASGEVARFALAEGAHIINDVTTLSEERLGHAVAEAGAWLVLSHSRAHQQEMTGFSEWPADAYHDVVEEVRRELEEARLRAIALGVAEERIVLDPGLGFSKNAQDSLELLRRLSELTADGSHWLVGPGRKSFISAVDPCGPQERLGGTIAAALWCADKGAAIVRVHDVRATRQALAVHQALRESPHAREERSPA